MSEAQLRVIKKKTPMSEVTAREINNPAFRQAYLREQITTRQLLELKARKQQILKRHANSIRDDPKKTLIFKFVKSQYIS